MIKAIDIHTGEISYIDEADWKSKKLMVHTYKRSKLPDAHLVDLKRCRIQ